MASDMSQHSGGLYLDDGAGSDQSALWRVHDQDDDGFDRSVMYGFFDDDNAHDGYVYHVSGCVPQIFGMCDYALLVLKDHFLLSGWMTRDS